MACLFKNFKGTSKEEQLIDVKRNGYYIEHIKNPLEEVQLAVKQNGYAIQYIKKPI